MTNHDIQNWWERSAIGYCATCGRYGNVVAASPTHGLCLLCTSIPANGPNPILAALSLLYDEKHPRKKPRTPKAPRGVILNPMLPARRRR